jgi:hypothetical protein
VADTRYKFNFVVDELKLLVCLKGVVFLFLLFLVSCNEDNFKREVPNDQLITVYIPKGAIQCEPDSGLTLQSSERTLVELSIDVTSSKCALNNLVDIMAECGAGTAEIIIHVIPQVSIEDVKKAGYKSTKSIYDEYTTIDCIIG